MPREQIRDRLRQEKAGGYNVCYDQSCRIELGKAVAASTTLSTELLKVGDSCAMTSTLFDLRSETTDRAASARTACKANALLSAVDSIMDQMKAHQSVVADTGEGSVVDGHSWIGEPTFFAERRSLL